MNRLNRILVVEDEFLIAMELAAVLAAHKFVVVGPVSTVEQALETIQRESLDAVILDLNLRGRLATPVARLLRELGVPFVIASAYSARDVPEDDALRGVVNVGKPTNSEALLGILRRITSQS